MNSDLISPSSSVPVSKHPGAKSGKSSVMPSSHRQRGNKAAIVSPDPNSYESEYDDEEYDSEESEEEESETPRR